MEKIPNLDRARIDERKLAGYLLSMGHPLGRGKASFFLRLGFRGEEPERFAQALQAHATTNPVSACLETPFGSKYVVDGPITTPDGRAVQLRAVWFVERGEEIPRFVTAYPGKGEIR